MKDGRGDWEKRQIAERKKGFKYEKIMRDTGEEEKEPKNVFDKTMELLNFL